MPPQNVRKKLITQKWFIILCIICTVILLIVVTFTILSNNEKDKALAYLDAKYGQTFVIKSQHIGIPFLLWQMDLVVSPANDPSIESKYSAIVFDEPGGIIVEDYLGTVWNHQASDGLKQFLENIYGVNNVPQYKDSYTTVRSFISEYNEGKTLNLQEAVSKYGDKIASGTLEIIVKSNNPFSDINSQATKFMQLIPYLQSIKVPKALFYRITSSSNPSYQCYLSVSQDTNESLENVTKCFREGEYVNYNN